MATMDRRRIERGKHMMQRALTTELDTKCLMNCATPSETSVY